MVIVISLLMLSDDLIREINAVRLGPGDVLVVKHPSIGQSVRTELKKALRTTFPGKKILLVPDYLTFEVVSPDALGNIRK